MSESTNDLKLTTDKIERLLLEKFPPKEGDPQAVYSSIILALSSRMDELDTALSVVPKLRGMVKFLTQKCVEAGIIEIHKKGEVPPPPAQAQAAPNASAPNGVPVEDEAEEDDESVEFIGKQLPPQVKGVQGASAPPPPTTVVTQAPPANGKA